jgi:hypothetical protein
LAGWQDILAVVLVAVAAWYLVRFLNRSLRGGSSGCHCGDDGSCGAAKSSDVDRTGIRRVPYVPVDQLGTDTQPTKPPPDA